MLLDMAGGVGGEGEEKERSDGAFDPMNAPVLYLFLSGSWKHSGDSFYPAIPAILHRSATSSGVVLTEGSK